MAARKKRGQSVELTAQEDPRAELNGGLLLAKAQELLRELEADLLARARGSAPVQKALKARHAAEKAKRRTADPLEVWERGFVTQVAASWFLSCVFVRTLEDRGLLDHARFAGPGALDSQRLFFEMAPSLTEREYMLTVFRELTRLPAAKELFDAKHNPVWMLGPSAEMAKKLLALFRTPSAEAPGFRFGQEDTRFLGDLYQDLSEEVRERFALLQTPRFVEKYILERTLDRAIQRFGLDETTIIDPTCGSGHFLLGAFERLFDERLRKEPGLDVRHVAKLALDAVYGADINPYAVGIARFRLTLVFLEKGGYRKLAEAPELPLHLVVADSLLHNPGASQTRLMDLPGQSAKHWAGDEFALEDEEAARAVLHRTFAAVVGNPPYITVKDAALRDEYRKMYSTAYKTYSMGVPFTERFFQLARRGGFVGMITANSFMKREFGKRLIEDFLSNINLDGVVNTSGAYIPGHGTPTVLLFGAAEPPDGDDVLAVLAKRGEPSTPEDPERGRVWRSIAQHGGEIGFENEYISVARVMRKALASHPWSLGGGGAAELKELLEERGACTLSDLDADVGTSVVTREDDLFLLGSSFLERHNVDLRFRRPLVVGENVRDWSIGGEVTALWPYDLESLCPSSDTTLVRLLWPWRRQLSERVAFGKTQIERGLPFTAYSMFFTERFRSPSTITFAFVATHNHFALDRERRVFGRSAPIIKLKDAATEEDYLALLAYLNSSTAAFYFRQVLHSKGAQGINEGHKAEEWEQFLEFSGTQVAKVPVPREWQSLAPLAREMLSLADARFREFSCDADAKHAEAKTLSKMVALQERIDFAVYRLFGLIDREPKVSPCLAPGSRFFEVQLVRDDTATAWFDRHGYVKPEPRLPTLDDLNLPPEVRLIETPTFKRRWTLWNHELAAHERLVSKTMDALEDLFRTSSEVRPLLKHVPPWATSDFVRKALLEESVPFLAAYRHTASGLEKRRVWEHVWACQDLEDQGKKPPPFEPPPKYDSKDYRDPVSWRLRGKLDVSKERFISYPGCESDEDKEPVFGWAGWNHLQQAQALAALYQARKNNEAWSKERLIPMLAGLLELAVWVKKWHNEPSEEFGGIRLGDYFYSFIDGECHALGLTRQDLRDWRPPEKTRAKKASASKAATAETTEVEP